MLLNGFWQGLDRNGRVGLLVGASLIVIATAVGGYYVMRTDYQVLFADMSMQDTAAMVAELDRLKVPYKLGEGGSSILVDKDLVHKTRLALMGKDLPLHGAVGLELFNTTDFGMTEFAQKINYQRALQGELTRTVLSLPEVQDARVHLAFPEQGLFKQPDVHPKAAIYLTIKRNQNLVQEQVSGIQRLVAAAVPGIAMQDVTIVDQHGVALTRAVDAEGTDSGSRMDVKREFEKYLSHKVGEVLDRAFGAGQAIASVDVSLNMDRVRLTQESVVGAPNGEGRAASGVVLRERQVTQDSAQSDARGTGSTPRTGNTEREVEYQVGRRVEQIVRQPGSIQQLQVVALVRKQLDAEQIERLKRVVGAAAGISLARGDTVEVQTLEPDAPLVTARPLGLGSGEQAVNVPASVSVPEKTGSATSNQVVVAVSLVLGVAALAGIGYAHRSRRRIRTLTSEQRVVALRQIEQWLQEERSEEAA
ncbi:MAG: flagellar basal-body MS-ring/collar protein FliF [Massilia sp.]